MMKRLESVEQYRKDVLIGLLLVCFVLLTADAYLFFTNSSSIQLPKSGWGIFHSPNIMTIVLSFMAGWVAVMFPSRPILLIPGALIVVLVYAQFVWAMLKQGNLMLAGVAILGGVVYVWKRFVLGSMDSEAV